MPAIEVRDLKKFYGDLHALKGVSFSVEPGEVVGLLGPNGAGKSTAMKIITGYIAQTAGQALVQGIDVLSDPVGAQQALGYLPENAPIYADMQVKEYLEYVGKIRSLGRGEIDRAIRTVAEQCGIEERLRQSIGELSKGYRQRVGLAQALLHSPPILILDEPTTGLDPNQIVEIRNLIRQIGRQKTVILSTHILSEVQATCDRVVIIHSGEIVADGATDEVTTHTRGGQLLELVMAPGKVAPQHGAVREQLESLDGVERVSPAESEDKAHYAFEILASTDVRADLFRLAVDQQLVLLELSRSQSNLEEVFRRLTIGPSAGAG